MAIKDFHFRVIAQSSTIIKSQTCYHMISYGLLTKYKWVYLMIWLLVLPFKGIKYSMARVSRCPKSFIVARFDLQNSPGIQQFLSTRCLHFGMMSVQSFRSRITVLMLKWKLRKEDLWSKHSNLPSGISLSEWEAGRQRNSLWAGERLPDSWEYSGMWLFDHIY